MHGSNPGGQAALRRVVTFAAVGICTAFALCGAPRGALAEAIERVRGNYLQQAVELATIDDRLVLLTRMTRFLRCGTRRGMAEDYNNHIVEVVGINVPDLGFVAGIVDSIEGCDRDTAGFRTGGVR